MALVKPHSFLSHVRGKLGDFVVKHYGDKVVITEVPVFKQPRAKAQKLNSGRFSKASDYAKYVQRNPERFKSYEAWARRLKRTVRSVAMSDFLTLPRLKGINVRGHTGEPGRCFGIAALKRFKVTSVFVVIRNAQGKVLEKGAAETNNKTRAFWTYRTQKPLADQGRITVEATATDRFGRTAVTSADKTF